jgi:hypothetical protein
MLKHAGFCLARICGRLMVAAGRHLHIYEVKPGKPLPEPAKILDLEAAI